jgi:putative membrane protein
MIDKLMLVAKGAAMGAADVVPGVSGGTIALLTGIYPRLINAITGLNLDSIKLLFKGDIKKFWQAIDGFFILPLLIGIASAFALLAHPIKYAISNHPIPTWSFFFGLIIAAAILIIKNIPNKKTLNYLWLIPGIVIGFWIGSLSAMPFPSSQIAILVSGMIAICAMILPGISGSFILVILGMYETLLTAVKNFHWPTLLIFMSGAVIGLMVFSRVLKLILAKFYTITLFFLSGLMMGSLVKVWPWKTLPVTTESNLINPHSLINVMPYELSDPQTTFAISMMFMAIILVFVIDFIGQKLSPNPSKEAE